MAGTISFNIKGLKEVQDKLDPKGHDTVCMRALNKTVGNVQAEGRRAIREQYNIKAKDVELKVVKANRMSLKAIIYAAYKPLSLLKFGAKQVKAGVSVMVKIGSKQILKNTFMAQPTGRDWKAFGQMKQVSSPVAMVFSRGQEKKKLFRFKRKNAYNNYPIDKLSGPSVGAMLKNESVQDRMQKIADERLENNLWHELDYYMQGLFK